MRVRAGLDAFLGDDAMLSILLGVQRFGTDQREDQDVFTPGNRLDGAVSWSMAVGARESVTVTAGVERRDDGLVSTSFGGLLESQAVFPGVGRQPARSVLHGQASFAVDRGEWIARPSVGLRALRSDDGLHQGWLASAGGSGEVRI